MRVGTSEFVGSATEGALSLVTNVTELVTFGESGTKIIPKATAASIVKSYSIVTGVELQACLVSAIHAKGVARHRKTNDRHKT